MTGFYVDFIELVVAVVISTFQEKRNKFGLTSTSEIVHNILYDFDKFKIELESKGTNILL